MSPRWIAQTRVFNPERTFNTSSYMVAGDSIRERNIGIAPGFPIRRLKRHELITTNDIAAVLGLKQGDQIQVDFDLFQIISSDFNKLKRLIYEYDEEKRSIEPQGQAILKFLKISTDLMIRPSDFIQTSMFESFIDI
jgi:hypothetical protein